MIVLFRLQNFERSGIKCHLRKKYNLMCESQEKVDRTLSSHAECNVIVLNVCWHDDKRIHLLVVQVVVIPTWRQLRRFYQNVVHSQTGQLFIPSVLSFQEEPYPEAMLPINIIIRSAVVKLQWTRLCYQLNQWPLYRRT